jgi:hypothetical protein
MAALDIAAIFAAVQTHIGTTGWFDRISGHEPKNAVRPGRHRGAHHPRRAAVLADARRTAR